MKDKIKLMFNPDYNTVAEVKDAAQILRDLLRKREHYVNAVGSHYPDPDDAIRFMQTFDTLTQGFEVAKQ